MMTFGSPSSFESALLAAGGQAAQVSNAITNALKEPDPDAVAVFVEYLDSGRFNDAEYARSTARWCKKKYAGVR